MLSAERWTRPQLLQIGAICGAVALASNVNAQEATAPVQDPNAVTEMSPETTNFIKGIALLLLPQKFEDDDNWGNKKRIQSGLNVKVRGFKVDTSRRWKDVNNGVWNRVEATLVDPQNSLQLRILNLPRNEVSSSRYRVSVTGRLNIVTRQQVWNLGVRLYSISANSTADLNITADVHIRDELRKTDDGTVLRVLPHIETASVTLQKYRLNGISHAKGGAVRGFGKSIEPILRRAVRKQGDKLAGKINSKIERKPERFEIPVGILAFLKNDDAEEGTDGQAM